jgi:peptidoglycan/LPS O-acetylase OafA/YrhL
MTPKCYFTLMEQASHNYEKRITEYRALDGYRFLAAVLVAVGHFNEGFQLGLEKITLIAERFGLFVDFFFILSGFVIALNYSAKITNLTAYCDFIWRRFARLWPLHVAVLIFFASIGLVGMIVGHQFNHPDAIKLSTLPWNLFLLHAWGPVWHGSFNAASWSISAEMFVYALFPLLSWQVQAVKGRWLPILLSFSIIIAFVIGLILLRDAMGLREWYKATYDWGMLRAIPSFMLGVVIHRIAQQETGLRFVTWPMAHGIFLFALLAMQFNAPAEAVIAIFGLFVFAAIKAEENVRDSWLSGDVCQRFGNASYALYMVHMPMMTCGMLVARRTTGLGGWSGWMFATILMIIAMMLAFWLFKGFENPLRKKLNKLSPFTEKRTNPAFALPTSS